MNIEQRHKIFFDMICKSEEEINAIFNSGMFNEIAIGYAKIALQNIGYKKNELQKFEHQMKYVFDDFTADEARKKYLTT